MVKLQNERRKTVHTSKLVVEPDFRAAYRNLPWKVSDLCRLKELNGSDRYQTSKELFNRLYKNGSRMNVSGKL
jgi:hypothetical protein